VCLQSPHDETVVALITLRELPSPGLCDMGHTGKEVREGNEKEQEMRKTVLGI